MSRNDKSRKERKKKREAEISQKNKKNAQRVESPVRVDSSTSSVSGSSREISISSSSSILELLSRSEDKKRTLVIDASINTPPITKTTLTSPTLFQRVDMAKKIIRHAQRREAQARCKDAAITGFKNSLPFYLLYFLIHQYYPPTTSEEKELESKIIKGGALLLISFAVIVLLLKPAVEGNFLKEVNKDLKSQGVREDPRKIESLSASINAWKTFAIPVLCEWQRKSPNRKEAKETKTDVGKEMLSDFVHDPLFDKNILLHIKDFMELSDKHAGDNSSIPVIEQASTSANAPKRFNPT